MPQRELSERDRSVLDFERTWTADRRGKGRAVREQLGLSPSRYYQLLADLVDRPEARHYDALLILRLQRRRAQRRVGRTAPIGLADQRGHGHTQ